MELLTAHTALQFGKMEVDSMDDGKTDHTLLNTLEFLIHIFLPQT